jgi:ABC-2 type transport system ATP-binding protein
MTDLLSARELGCRDGRRQRVAGIDLALAAGETVGLLGTNGAGKSTTLGMLAGTLTPTQGRVEVLGSDLHRGPRSARRAIGLLPEHPPLHPDLTVAENLFTAARLQGLPRHEAASACERAMARCDLHRLAGRLADRLSRGEAQRAALAQAIVHEPSVLLLDEPTAGLDPLQAAAFHDLLRALQPGRAILLSTHLLADVDALCTRVLVLHEGRPALHRSLAASAGRSVRVVFGGPVSREALAALPGVAQASSLDAATWILELDARAPPDTAEWLAGRGWCLRSCTPVDNDLAALFGNLLTGGPAA